MYPVSNAYKATLRGGLIDSDIHGTIKTKNGQTIQVTEKDIVPGSLTVANKAVNSADFNFGGIYVGELSVTIMQDIDRYSLYDAEVSFVYSLACLDGSVQEIPLGLYNIVEAKRARRTISFKAYDRMILFDKPVVEDTEGTLWDCLAYVCERCGVELAHTQDEVLSFVNGDWWIHIYQDNLSTYREFVSNVGLLTGRFATMTRDGKLCFREFQREAQEQIPANMRTLSSIQDYRTQFSAVRARFFASENWYPYEAVDVDIPNGLVLDLGDIAIFRGEDENKNTIVQNLLNIAKNTVYIPAEFQMISDPSIELGDCLELTNANGTGDSVLTAVHSMSWKYHGEQKIVSYGSDPRLKGIATGDEKIFSEIRGEVAKQEVVVKTYTNSRRLTFGSAAETDIITINFVSTKDTTAIFFATIPIETELDGLVVLRYYLDGVQGDTLRQYVDRGHHVLTVENYFPMSADARKTLTVTIATEAFESDNRRHNAKVLSLVDYVTRQSIVVDGSGVPGLSVVYEEQTVDTTPATGAIEKSTIRAILFGQGLQAGGQWDGTINISETFEGASFNLSFGAGEFGESFNVGTHTPVGGNVSEIFRSVGFDLAFSVGSFSSSVGFSDVVEQEPIVPDDPEKVQTYTFDEKYVTTDGGRFALRTQWRYTSEEQTIDTGRMTSVKAVTIGLKTVESVVVE